NRADNPPSWLICKLMSTRSRSDRRRMAPLTYTTLASVKYRSRADVSSGSMRGGVVGSERTVRARESAMTRNPGMLYLALIVSVLLSCVAACIIAHRYRRRMQQLMRAPRAGDSTAPAIEAGAVSPPRPALVSLADNRAAGMRLTVLLIALSCLLAVTSA